MIKANEWVVLQAGENQSPILRTTLEHFGIRLGMTLETDLGAFEDMQFAEGFDQPTVNVEELLAAGAEVWTIA